MYNDKTVGIIGLGNFGSLIATLAPAGMQVFGYSRSGKTLPGVTAVDFNTAAQADVVVLAVPLAAYPKVLKQLARVLRPESLLIDVCSVKEAPEKLIAEYLPAHHNILMTHPLFGPHSAVKGVRGCTLVVTDSHGERAVKVLRHCQETLGLIIKEVSAKEHDQIMARVHVLTFFVARGLARLGQMDEAFSTPSYRMVSDLIQLDATRSDDLFQTIQRGNAYGDEVRKKFIKVLEDLEKELRP